MCTGATDKQTDMGKRSPDISKCRAAMLGAGQLVFCHSDQQAACDYALPFGVKHFCIHPQSLDIAAQTEATPNPDGGGTPD